MIGTVLGGYKLAAELGSGGMGTVYFAEHLVIGRRAAIKVLHGEVAGSADAVARFHVEARAVNDIRHPNVVQITDIGVQDDVSYIIMELLEGETLGERLERSGACDERTTIRIARQVASALGAAHDRGIVHRDLKPENVFLTNHPDYPDHVKLLDFGIAKLIGAQDKASGKATQTGVLIGTPAYMSPEQCRGEKELDHRSDVYSLGVMLYEMVTGRQPFQAEGFAQVILAHVLEKPTPPRELAPALSLRLNDVILKALEKEPAKRFASMKELREAMDDEPIEIPAPLPAATKTPASGVPAATATPTVATVAQIVAEASAAPKLLTRAEREARAARLVVDKLNEIILSRLASDRLALPAMPGIAFDVMQAMKQPQQTFGSVASIAARDPMLAARILRLANSAAFQSRTPATTLEQAIARMGIDGLTIALVEFSMEDVFLSRDDRIRAAFRGIWEHSIATALLAKDLALLSGPGAPESSTAYLAGLLHDVGKPVVASMLLEAERMVEKSDLRKHWMSEAVWKRVVAESHRAVGCALAEKWNLPKDLSAAIRDSRQFEAGDARSAGNYVCLANALAKREGLYVGDVVTQELYDAIGSGRTLLRLDAGAIDQACATVHKRLRTMVDPASSTKPPRNAPRPAALAR